eukprot:1924571-Rhodomonas_salina.1
MSVGVEAMSAGVMSVGVDAIMLCQVVLRHAIGGRLWSAWCWMLCPGASRSGVNRPLRDGDHPVSVGVSVES